MGPSYLSTSVPVNASVPRNGGSEPVKELVSAQKSRRLTDLCQEDSGD